MKTFDALLHEWNSDLPRIWIPLIAGAAMLVGLFGGLELQATEIWFPQRQQLRRKRQYHLFQIPNRRRMTYRRDYKAATREPRKGKRRRST